MTRLQRFPDDTTPACAGPALLPLVDAAFTSPGGPAGLELRTQYCRFCPVAAQCLDEAMRRGEYGVWGGTSLHARTAHGGRPTRIRDRRREPA